MKICYHVIADDEMAAAGVTGATNQEYLPFEKNKLLWEAVESLEAFSAMPQKPHFRPLESCREIQREGKALSLMVHFNKIAKKTWNLQYDAPREDIANDLALLRKLETHGFDVMKLTDPLTGILFLKDPLEDTENLLKENVRRLTEFDHQKSKAKAICIKVQNEITRVMNEYRVVSLSEKKVDDDIASEQLELRKVDYELTRLNWEIEELVATPLC